MFQHTAARRRLDALVLNILREFPSFNTQPPEGGWHCQYMPMWVAACFNTQPPEGGWLIPMKLC